MDDPISILKPKNWTLSGIFEALLLLFTIVAGALYIVEHMQPKLLTNFNKEWSSFLYGGLNFILEIGPNVRNLIIGILEGPIEIYRTLSSNTATVTATATMSERYNHYLL